jgi:soluble cytochrome b562
MAGIRVLLIFATLSLPVGVLHAGEEDQPSPVDLLMEQMSRDLKKLSRQFDNPASRESSLSLADGLIEVTLKAKAIDPESIGKRTGAERDEYMALYHRGMDALLNQFQALKKALEEDEAGLAEAAMEEIYALREKYHKDLGI